MDKGLGRERTGALSFAGAVLITKGDLAILHFENALVAQRHAEDVGGQVYLSSPFSY